MEYSFNWNAVSSGAPYVTISNLSIAFNGAAVAMLDSPEQVLIGFDVEHKVLGVKPYSGEPNVKTFDFSKPNKGWVRVGCKDFVRYLTNTTGIKFNTAKRYVAKHDAATGILMVEILKGDVQE